MQTIFIIGHLQCEKYCTEKTVGTVTACMQLLVFLFLCFLNIGRQNQWDYHTTDNDFHSQRERHRDVMREEWG